jgi:hypothetical protein
VSGGSSSGAAGFCGPVCVGCISVVAVESVCVRACRGLGSVKLV